MMMYLGEGVKGCCGCIVFVGRGVWGWILVIHANIFHLPKK